MGSDRLLARLRALKRRQTVKELAAYFAVSATTVNHALRFLEKQGHVNRQKTDRYTTWGAVAVSRVPDAQPISEPISEPTPSIRIHRIAKEEDKERSPKQAKAVTISQQTWFSII